MKKVFKTLLLIAAIVCFALAAAELIRGFCCKFTRNYMTVE